MPSPSTLRYFDNTMIAGSADSDINDKAILIFSKCLDLRKMSYSQTAS